MLRNQVSSNLFPPVNAEATSKQELAKQPPDKPQNLHKEYKLKLNTEKAYFAVIYQVGILLA